MSPPPDPKAPVVDSYYAEIATQDQVEFLTTSPLMDSRRIHLDTQDLVQLLGAQLIRGGLDPVKLTKASWLWVGTTNGHPELYLILPGHEA